MKGKKHGFKHGLKHQFSILLDQDVTGRALDYGTKECYTKKSHLFSKLISKGLDAIHSEEDMDDKLFKAYQAGYSKCLDIVKANSKSKKLKESITNAEKTLQSSYDELVISGEFDSM